MAARTVKPFEDRLFALLLKQLGAEKAIKAFPKVLAALRGQE